MISRTCASRRNGRTTMWDRNLPRPDVKCVRPRIAMIAVWLGCLVINAIPMATAASAHVKWLVTCNPSDDPLPIQAVFKTPFWLFSALFVLLFYLACVVEETSLGTFALNLLNRCTSSL